MSRPDYTSTARALASQISDSSSDHHPRSSSPLWTRRRPRDRPPSTWHQTASNLHTRLTNFWTSLTRAQKLLLIATTLLALLLSLLFLIYTPRIFSTLAPLAQRWRNLPGGWLLLWSLTFLVAFPPMIGYSTCVTTAGFVFGLPRGWLIVASATILGSTASFLASRTVGKRYVSRLTARDTRFAALSAVLKRDGLGLLCMIRLCPLPYSLANGAISTIPSVTWGKFMLATAVVSPKLLLHVFVGGRLGAIAEEGERMDGRTKVVSYLSVGIGMVVGVGTGWVIYTRTKARAKVLEAEEEAAAALDGARRRTSAGGYVDDLDEERPGRREDEISLHQTYEDDLEGGSGYRDQFTDDEDAVERDVFDAGDETEEEGDGGGGGYLDSGKRQR